MTIKVPHQLYRASAGSGKTFQLAHRYIRLLALGEDPGRIIALTFARKAAGEMFDKILDRLASAAENPKVASETAAIIAMPELGPAEFEALLAKLVRALPRLQIATLDSFIVSIVRSFALELGIDPDLSMTDSESIDAQQRRAETLRTILGIDSLTTGDRQAFIEAFKHATFGREERSPVRLMDEFVRAHQETFHQLPSPRQWGHDPTIWPGDQPWFRMPVDFPATLERFRQWVALQGWSGQVTGWWEKFLEACETWNPAGDQRPLNGHREKLDRFLAALLPPGGEVAISAYRTSCLLTPVAADDLRAILAHMLQREIDFCQEQTQGLYKVLAMYEVIYDAQVRRRGALTFHDAIHLLAGHPLTGQPDAGNRLWLDYRLDRRIDHWLMDEFQDISGQQWQVLENLIDETIQDTEGRRSFFCVGDTKQSIYRWRGARPELMMNLDQRYGPALEIGELTTSWRSSPAVIDVVNQVFGHLPLDANMDEPTQRACAEWAKTWSAHTTRPKVEHTGYVTLIEPDSEGGNVKPGDDEKHAVVAALLNRLRPLERGLSVGLLVRTNKAGVALSQTLRVQCPDMPVVLEGQTSILDNPATCVLMSLIKAVAHPEDTLAWRHLEMSPLARDIPATLAKRSEWMSQTLASIQSQGFAPWIAPWGEKIMHESGTCAFTRQRLDEFMAAVKEVDARGVRDPDTLLATLDEYCIREHRKDAVRIMTIFQAKGLEFDLVILPDLQGRGGRPDEMLIAADPTDPFGPPRWALKRPRGAWISADPELQQARFAQAQADAFEDLCVLYVAMTRAVHALYIVTTFPGKTSKAFTEASLLKTCFGCDPKATEGDPWEPMPSVQTQILFETDPAHRNWIEAFPLLPSPSRVEDITAEKEDRNRDVFDEVKKSSPSSEAEEPRLARLLFSPTARDRRAVGKGVHEVFERIEWLSDQDSAESLMTAWENDTGPTSEVARWVKEHIDRAFTSDAFRSALHHPGGHAEVWREVGFDVVIDQTWVTGTFDRVVLRGEGPGAWTQADILDFKTNAISSEDDEVKWVKHYTPQLDLYRRVLATLTGIDPECIDTRLLFTVTGAVRTCSSS